MKKVILRSVLIVGTFLISYFIYAQVEVTEKLCTSKLKPPYISDGQQYKAFLNGDEVAEFHSTFYGGSTYRLVANSGQEEGNLKFSIYDSQRNLLFSNVEYNNSSYWDFKFTSTVDCIIEAELNTKKLSSGFALLLIGFKQN